MCTAPGNGIQMKIWDCYSGITAQTWYYTDDKRIALYNLGTLYCTGLSCFAISLRSFIGQCLDLTNGSSANGNVLQTWSCTTGNNNQVWTE